MVITSFRKFLDLLSARQELKVVEDAVSPDLEIAHILREVCYRGGPALLFTNVINCDVKLVGNLFGTWRRVELALEGRDVVEPVRDLLSITRLHFRSIVDVVRTLPDALRVNKYFPKLVGKGPVQEVKWDEFDLRRLGAIRQWPREPARFFTMGITFVKRGDKMNFGYYRLQVIDRDKLVMHWMPWRKSREIAEMGDEEVDVAIVFGPDPIVMLMASVPIPGPIDKILVTGAVRGEGIELVKGKTVDVYYPADAELVIEGKVKLTRTVPEGPFGDHAGFYSPVREYPIVEVTAVYSREDPIVPVTVTGKPILEDGNMILFGEKVVLPLIQSILPEIVDLHIMPEAVGYVTIVSIRKRYPGHAKRIMFFLWAMMPVLNKIVIVVDHDVNVRDMKQVIYAIAVNVDPQRDVLIVPGYATEELDPATPVVGYGSKLGIDATRKFPEEYAGQQYPEEVAPDPETVRKVSHIIERILSG